MLSIQQVTGGSRAQQPKFIQYSGAFCIYVGDKRVGSPPVRCRELCSCPRIVEAETAFVRVFRHRKPTVGTQSGLSCQHHSGVLFTLRTRGRDLGRFM